jgi:hypothetical protein
MGRTPRAIPHARKHAPARRRVIAAASLALAVTASSPASAQDDGGGSVPPPPNCFISDSRLTRIEFPAGATQPALPYPQAHQLTNEYADRGLVFSDADADIPAGLKKLDPTPGTYNTVVQSSLGRLYRVNFRPPPSTGSRRSVPRGRRSTRPSSATGRGGAPTAAASR